MIVTTTYADGSQTQVLSDEPWASLFADSQSERPDVVTVKLSLQGR